jgi:hypothetical protein
MLEDGNKILNPITQIPCIVFKWKHFMSKKKSQIEKRKDEDMRIEFRIKTQWKANEKIDYIYVGNELLHRTSPLFITWAPSSWAHNEETDCGVDEVLSRSEGHQCSRSREVDFQQSTWDGYIRGYDLAGSIYLKSSFRFLLSQSSWILSRKRLD